MTLLTDRRKTAVWALVVALLAATFFTTGGTASANETIATATNLGNWDNNTTTGSHEGGSLTGNNRVEYYKFVLTGEKYVTIKAVEQNHARAKMSIVDAEDNTIFKGNGEGWVVSSNQRKYHDKLHWKVIGPGTWYIKINQSEATYNNYDWLWKVKDAPAFVNDDFAAGNLDHRRSPSRWFRRRDHCEPAR